MAIEYTETKAIITCDKCGHNETAPIGSYDDQFFSGGWGLYSNAKKYKHRCRKCQPMKDRKAHDFVASKFFKPLNP